MKPTEIVKDANYPKMYRLKWEDGVLSKDFYNQTRANDILQNYDLYVMGMKMWGNQRAKLDSIL